MTGVIKLEDFDIEAPEQYSNQLEGQIERIAYRGRNTKLILDVDEMGVLEVFTSELEDYDVGKTITVGWPTDACSTYAGGG